MYLAPLAEYPPKLLPSLSYNGLYNVLDFPVGSVPVDNFTTQDEVSILTCFHNQMHYMKSSQIKKFHHLTSLDFLGKYDALSKHRRLFVQTYTKIVPKCGWHAVECSGDWTAISRRARTSCNEGSRANISVQTKTKTKLIEIFLYIRLSIIQIVMVMSI